MIHVLTKYHIPRSKDPSNQRFPKRALRHLRRSFSGAAGTNYHKNILIIKGLIKISNIKQACNKKELHVCMYIDISK